jgi:hypothetical protein
MEEIEKPIKRLEFVVKISKYCNLRCRYCYEMNDLDKRDKASFNSEETLPSTMMRAILAKASAVRLMRAPGCLARFLVKPGFSEIWVSVEISKENGDEQDRFCGGCLIHPRGGHLPVGGSGAAGRTT